MLLLLLLWNCRRRHHRQSSVSSATTKNITDPLPSFPIIVVPITTTGKTTTNNDNSKNSEYFETTSSQDDTECIWYRTARNEWKRQQQIIGDYIPSYTTVQKDRMIQNLTHYLQMKLKPKYNSSNRKNNLRAVTIPTKSTSTVLKMQMQIWY